MAVRKYKAGKLFNKFLKLTIGAYMRLLFDYSITTERLEGMEPPYLVLANHTNFWDPFLLSMCFPEPVYFVTSDAYFRNAVLKRLLKLVGAIPKTKLISDPGSIRGILEVVRNKGIIGVFPEGRRSWDGRTLPLLRPTAKLVKALGIPVVSVLFKGAYLSMPRWASSTRKGSLVMEVSKVLEPQEIKSLSADEIYDIISASIKYDEYDHQRLRMNRYKGAGKAEHLELFLFTCPECVSDGSMVSRGDELSCRSCGYQAVYNSCGFFESSGQLYFDNPKDWNLWQLEKLETRIADSVKSGEPGSIMDEPQVIMRTGAKTGALGAIKHDGTLALYPGELVYETGCSSAYHFPIIDISGMNVQFNNQLEFFYDETLYRFSKKNGLMPAYKFTKGIDTINKLAGGGL